MTQWLNDSIFPDFQPQLFKLLGFNTGRRLTHQIHRAGRLGEGDYLADVRLACHKREDAVVAQGNATVGWCSVF